jgi:predicted P-loop ATPase
MNRPAKTPGKFSSAFAEIIKGPLEAVYEPAFIAICAVDALDSEIWECRKQLRKLYGNEFAANKFSALIKEARESLAVASEDRYIYTAAGLLRPVVANAITMLEEVPVRYNQLAERPELNGEPPWGGDAREWSDDMDTRAAEWCQHQGLHVASNLVAEAIQTVSRARAYHPVQEYLAGREWDGKERLPTWLLVYAGVEESELVQEIGVRWMISAVARAYQPGCQADYTLVMEGVEGIKKSSALRALGDPWFSDDIGNVGDGHRAAEGLQGHWIVEIKELSAFRKTEWTQVKAWLDRRQDKFRPAYGRRLATYPRQNIFSASTNKRQWIDDDTGARRFWPIWCKKLDVDALYRDRDQLWAEAAALYKRGEQWHLVEEMNAAATREQTKRRFTDPWKGIVKTWCARPGASTVAMDSTSERIVVGEILEYCLKIPRGQWRPAEGLRVESILRDLGYTREDEGIFGRY